VRAGFTSTGGSTPGGTVSNGIGIGLGRMKGKGKGKGEGEGEGEGEVSELTSFGAPSWESVASVDCV
jgi:hypothetical protein